MAAPTVARVRTITAGVLVGLAAFVAVATAAADDAALTPVAAPASYIVGPWLPTSTGGHKALDAAERTADSFLSANPTATGYRVYACARQPIRSPDTGPRRRCLVRFYWPEFTIDLAYTVEREMMRKRRGNRWVGPWFPTGDFAVVADELLRRG